MELWSYLKFPVSVGVIADKSIPISMKNLSSISKMSAWKSLYGETSCCNNWDCSRNAVNNIDNHIAWKPCLTTIYSLVTVKLPLMAGRASAIICENFLYIGFYSARSFIQFVTPFFISKFLNITRFLKPLGTKTPPFIKYGKMSLILAMVVSCKSTSTCDSVLLTTTFKSNHLRAGGFVSHFPVKPRFKLIAPLNTWPYW